MEAASLVYPHPTFFIFTLFSFLLLQLKQGHPKGGDILGAKRQLDCGFLRHQKANLNLSFPYNQGGEVLDLMTTLTSRTLGSWMSLSAVGSFLFLLGNNKKARRDESEGKEMFACHPCASQGDAGVSGAEGMGWQWGSTSP